MNFPKLRFHSLLILALCSLVTFFCIATSIVSAHPSDPVIAQQPAMIRSQRANTFELQGDGVRITYSATSINGEPELRYQALQRQRIFRGSEIRSTETEIGQLLTVTLEQVPDLRKTTLTLLLPIVNLRDSNAQRPVQTSAIETAQRTSIGGPDLVDGQVQTYRTLRLRGTARLLKF